MPIHTDEHCNCTEPCDLCCDGTCAACCTRHDECCRNCGCEGDSTDVLCECPCHSDVMSDRSERAAERRQMGIT